MWDISAGTVTITPPYATDPWLKYNIIYNQKNMIFFTIQKLNHIKIEYKYYESLYFL